MALSGNFFIQIFITYYMVYIFRMLTNKKKRKQTQAVNKKLSEMREIPIKTLEQQKEFINIKYPKRGKFKFKWSMIPRTLVSIVIFIFIYKGWRLLFNHFNIIIPIWLAIIIVMLLPVGMNLILEKFNLEKSDWRIFVK